MSAMSKRYEELKRTLPKDEAYIQFMDEVKGKSPEQIKEESEARMEEKARIARELVAQQAAGQERNKALGWERVEALAVASIKEAICDSACRAAEFGGAANLHHKDLQKLLIDDLFLTKEEADNILTNMLGAEYKKITGKWSLWKDVLWGCGQIVLKRDPHRSISKNFRVKHNLTKETYSYWSGEKNRLEKENERYLKGLRLGA